MANKQWKWWPLRNEFMSWVTANTPRLYCNEKTVQTLTSADEHSGSESLSLHVDDIVERPWVTRAHLMTYQTDLLRSTLQCTIILASDERCHDSASVIVISLPLSTAPKTHQYHYNHHHTEIIIIPSPLFLTLLFNPLDLYYLVVKSNNNLIISTAIIIATIITSSSFTLSSSSSAAAPITVSGTYIN